MFRYYMPTEIHFGRDCLLNKGELISKLGRKALIVTGSSSAKKSGALAVVEKELRNSSVSYSIFSQIRENPDIETIMLGVEQFKAENCNIVIGIGGGSPIDAAKAISVVAANNLSSSDINNPQNIVKAYPIITIPTTSGTGTEATPYSVITSGEKKAGFGSPLMYPAISFLDPTFTMTLSDKVTRDTAIDALSHLLEGLYSNKRCPLVFPLILTGINIIFYVLKKTIQEPDNYEYRKQLMIASLYGGMVIAQTSTTLQHSIGYPLTTHIGLSHGLANGVVMKDIMELYYPSIKEHLDLLFAHLNITKTDFYKWLESFGMETNLNLTSEFIDKAAEEISNSRNMAMNPLEVDKEVIKSLLQKL